jgi:hypothetical protein
MKFTITAFLLLIVSALPAQDTLPAEPEDSLEFKRGFLHFYYSYDVEDRPFYTDHFIFDAGQEFNGAGLTRSFSLGLGWTQYFHRNFAVSGGAELSFKNCMTDTIYFPAGDRDKFAVYSSAITYCNLPVGVQYAIGRGKCAQAFTRGSR